MPLTFPFTESNAREYDNVAAVQAAQIPLSVTHVVTAGYNSPGDGGNALYKRVNDEPSHAGKILSADGAWWEISETTVTVKMFGAVGDGVVDDTTAMQAAFDYCRDNDVPWFIDNGSYLISAQIMIYNSGSCSGRVIKTNTTDDPAVNISPVSSDVTTISAATINGWTALDVRGTSKSNDVNGLVGYTFSFLSSDEQILTRDGDSLNYREVFVTNKDNGSFFPPIANIKTTTWTEPNTIVKRVRNRKPICITNLIVVISAGAGALSAGIITTRPNVEHVGCAVINESGTPINQGFKAECASGLTYIGCYVEQTLEDATNYGYNFDRCCSVTLLNCSEVYCRRGIDNHGSKDVNVIGGSWPDGIGAHWVNGLRVSGGAFISSKPTDIAPITVAGSDIIVRDCSVLVRSDQTTVATIRGDIFEVRDTFAVDDCDIEFDCTANTTSIRNIFNLDYSGTHDWGRAVYLPQRISFCRNRVHLRGASYNNVFYLVRILTSVPTAPSGIIGYGCIDISGNLFEIDAGDTYGGNPRIVISSYKIDTWTNAKGYNIRVKDIPNGLYCYFHCSATTGSPSAARHDFYGTNLGTCLWKANYGAWRYMSVDCDSLTAGLLTVTPPLGGYATPIGDERKVRTTELLARVAWNPSDIANGVSTSTTVTVPGATAGDPVVASHDQITSPGLMLYGICTSADTVTVTLFNCTGGNYNVANGYLYVKVLKL